MTNPHASLLYVDDQAEVYQALVILLQRHGFQVASVHSCDEAFQFLSHHHIDLVLLDVKMPNVDGYETCRRLRADHRFQNLPVIFMTVCNEETEIRKCFDAGANDYVNKGINADELCARVKIHLRLADVLTRENRERRILRQALDNMKDQAIIVDPGGFILFANAPAEETFGKEITDRPYLEVMSDKGDLGVPQLQQAIAGSCSVSARVQNDGRVFSISVEPIREAGNAPDSFFLILRDITAEIESEAALRRAQKMASVGRLAGGIAHDLNNILGGMVGYISLLKAKTAHESPIFGILENIDSASERATEVIAKLMEFASVQEVHPQTVDLNAEIRKLGPALRNSMRHSVVLDFDLASHLPTLQADLTQMKQLVINLVYAAANAGVRGSGILIRTAYRQEEHPALRLTVEFFSSTPVAVSGTDGETGLAVTASLGLAIVRDIVEFYHGRFGIRSGKDCQVAFDVDLPAEAASANEAVEVPVSRNQILVVDDEQIILQMLEDCFEMLGYVGHFASSGPQGIELFRLHSSHIGLVILDLVMPGMGGEEVLKQLREIDPNIRVLISSAYSVAQKNQIQARMRADAFLSKPFKINELQEVIDSLLPKES